MSTVRKLVIASMVIMVGLLGHLEGTDIVQTLKSNLGIGTSMLWGAYIHIKIKNYQCDQRFKREIDSILVNLWWLASVLSISLLRCLQSDSLSSSVCGVIVTTLVILASLGLLDWWKIPRSYVEDRRVIAKYQWRANTNFAFLKNVFRGKKGTEKFENTVKRKRIEEREPGMEVRIFPRLVILFPEWQGDHDWKYPPGGNYSLFRFLANAQVRLLTFM